jgi:hypothetical protein
MYDTAELPIFHEPKMWNANHCLANCASHLENLNSFEAQRAALYLLAEVMLNGTIKTIDVRFYDNPLLVQQMVAYFYNKRNTLP